jgi:hypothetical protein
VSRLTYASPAWRGFITASDFRRVDAFLRRCKRSGYCPSDLPDFDELLGKLDDRLFLKTLNNPNHTLHTLIPPQSAASQHYSLRQRTHDMQLPVSDVNEAPKFEAEAETELIGLRTTPNKVIKM